jgi:hypothetical protein
MLDLVLDPIIEIANDDKIVIKTKEESIVF